MELDGPGELLLQPPVPEEAAMLDLDMAGLEALLRHHGGRRAPPGWRPCRECAEVLGALLQLPAVELQHRAAPACCAPGAASGGSCSSASSERGCVTGWGELAGGISCSSNASSAWLDEGELQLVPAAAPTRWAVAAQHTQLEAQAAAVRPSGSSCSSWLAAGAAAPAAPPAPMVASAAAGIAAAAEAEAAAGAAAAAAMAALPPPPPPPPPPAAQLAAVAAARAALAAAAAPAPAPARPRWSAPPPRAAATRALRALAAAAPAAAAPATAGPAAPVAPAAPTVPPAAPAASASKGADAAPVRTRAEAVARFRAKRERRLAGLTQPKRYLKRKAVADRRPRVGGRFIKVAAPAPAGPERAPA